MSANDLDMHGVAFYHISNTSVLDYDMLDICECYLCSYLRGWFALMGYATLWWGLCVISIIKSALHITHVFKPYQYSLTESQFVVHEIKLQCSVLE